MVIDVIDDATAAAVPALRAARGRADLRRARRRIATPSDDAEGGRGKGGREEDGGKGEDIRWGTIRIRKNQK